MVQTSLRPASAVYCLPLNRLACRPSQGFSLAVSRRYPYFTHGRTNKRMSSKISCPKKKRNDGRGPESPTFQSYVERPRGKGWS